MCCSQPGEGQLKQDNQNCEDKYKEVENDFLCNISKQESYLGLDCEELNNINMIASDDNEGGNKLIK